MEDGICSLEVGDGERMENRSEEGRLGGIKGETKVYAKGLLEFQGGRSVKKIYDTRYIKVTL